MKIAFSVPKKFFKKAVDRNLLKRRCREAYRLNNSALKNQLMKHGKSLEILIVYNSSEIADFATIQDKIILILRRLAEMNE